MRFPDVVHPKRIYSHGCVFEVVAYCKLTDQQALKVIRHYVRTHRITMKGHGKLIQIVTVIDRDSVGLL
jgi:hypothetical protein